jgi:sulfonate transport system substrate-binding protein
MRRPHPSLVPLAALAVAAAVAVPACSGGGSSSASGSGGAVAAPADVSPAALSAVTLRVGDQKGGAQALLDAAGLDKDLPYKIQWSTFTSGPPLLEAANAGAIDVGNVGNTPPLFAAAAGSKVAIVAATQENPDTSAILVPAGSASTAPAQLRGQKIAVSKGSSAHGQLLLALKKVGLTPSDVQISYLQPADAFTAFSTHQVDAWAIWSPYAEQAQQQLGAKVLEGGSDGSANGYGFTVASRSALADAGRNTALKDYVTRLAKAQAWAQTHKAQWAATWASITGLSTAVTTAAVADEDTRSIPLSPAVVASEQQLADAFTAAGQLPAKVDVQRFVDTRYAAALQPHTS